MKLRRGKPKIPMYSRSILGINQAKNVLDDLDKVKLRIAHYRDEARDSAELSRKNAGEYDWLNSAYLDLLKQVSEAVLQWETQLKTTETPGAPVQSLNAALEQHGVAKFAPAIGDPANGGKCKVAGEVEAKDISLGMVAKVLSPGFQLKEGLVLLKAVVLVSSGDDASKGPVGPTSPETSTTK
jgi:molecular chaperone GrpE (heat shock protein)